MKKSAITLVAVAAVSLLLTQPAYAQNASFAGFYGQLGLGVENISPSFSNSGVNIAGFGYVPYSTSIDSATSFVGTVTAGYLFAVSKNFLLGIGAEFSPFESQSADYSVGVSGLGSIRGSYKKQNAYNVFISPATPLGDKGLLYAKIGYTGASIKSTLGGNASTGQYHGYSLGLGYKHFVSGNLYGFVEGNYFGYGNNTTVNNGFIGNTAFSESLTSSANAYNVLVGIGYTF